MPNVADRDDPVEHVLEQSQWSEPWEERVSDRTLEVEAEEAQGVEVFENPDASVPVSLLKEGAPGHETYSADGADLYVDDEELPES